MNLQDALTALKQGQKIKRPSWYEIWMCIVGDEVKYFDETVSEFFDIEGIYSFNSEDLLAEDWEVITDQRRIMTLEEAEKLLANKTCSKTETIKITIESKVPFKRTATGEVIIFKGVRGAVLDFKAPHTYTVLIRAHSLKAYFAKHKGDICT